MPWTADDIPEQAGRRFVITGANSGIGLQAAIALARAGADVVLACRNLEKGRKAEDEVRAASAGGSVELASLDLASLDSVRAFADGLDGELDVLVNNAGVMALPRRHTADGFEMQFGTNHLGHFALTGLLLDRVRDRVVTLSSNAHTFGRIAFDNLDGARKYFRWTAYGQSKLANLLFALELQRRLDAAGSPVRSVACHPGFAATNLQFQAAQLTGNRIEALANAVLNKTIAQSAEAGALPTLYAATVEDIPGGAYVGPDGRGEWRGSPRITAPAGRALKQDDARRLWEVSEELTGVSFAL